MAIGKKITRKKAGSGPTVNYFTEATQDAIVRFKNEPDIEKRKKIYMEEIKSAFETLIENLINVYGFHVLYESKDDLRNHCVADLYEIIYKFDPSKGSKAFSYFNVVAKNWLTMRSKTNAKAIQTFTSLDNREAFSAHELDLIENFKVIPAADEMTTQEDINTNIKNTLEEVRNRSKTDNERATVDAVKVLFGRLEDLDFANKRAIMIYVREICLLTPKQLSIVLSSLKKYYKAIKNEEYEEI
jgi:hypothetical protein